MKNTILTIACLAFTLFADINLENSSSQLLFESLGLEGIMSRELFHQSFSGYQKLLEKSVITDTTKLTIIDFSKASTEKRFFLIDLKEKKLLFNTYVAHGRNSGNNFADKFSNTEGSLQSSLGFFVTSKTYYGKHGYSMRLKGMEKMFNSNAEERAIVVHGADYVSESFIKKYGRLGRSWGCPALSRDISSDVINLIKDGTCLFIYSDDPNYLATSAMLK